MTGKNIKRLREAGNLTQAELAERISVTRQAVSNWETGKTEPDLSTLRKLMKILNASADEIICGKNDKTDKI